MDLLRPHPEAPQHGVAAAGLLARLLIVWQQQLLLLLTGQPQATNVLATRLFYAVQKRLRPSVSLEIGAREAGFSRHMRELFPDMSIAAFEANPIAHKHFSGEYDFGSLAIAYHNMAVSDKNGLTPFYLISEHEGLSGRNSLMPRRSLPSVKTTVKCARGDSFLKTCPQGEAVLWIDVEGAAEPVLRGFEESLRSGRVSSLFVEVEDAETWQGQWLSHDVARYLMAFGYVPFFCDIEFYRALRRDGKEMSQYNVIFIRADLLTEDFIGYCTGFLVETAHGMRIEPC